MRSAFSSPRAPVSKRWRQQQRLEQANPWHMWGLPCSPELGARSLFRTSAHQLQLSTLNSRLSTLNFFDL